MFSQQLRPRVERPGQRELHDVPAHHGLLRPVHRHHRHLLHPRHRHEEGEDLLFSEVQF